MSKYEVIRNRARHRSQLQLRRTVTFLAHEYSTTVPTRHVECFAVSSRVAAYICATHCRSLSRKRQYRVLGCMHGECLLPRRAKLMDEAQ